MALSPSSSMVEGGSETTSTKNRLESLPKGGTGTSHMASPIRTASLNQSFHMAAMQALNRMGKRSPLRIWERCFREYLASAVICAERDQQGQQADDVGISETRKGGKPGLLSSATGGLRFSFHIAWAAQSCPVSSLLSKRCMPTRGLKKRSSSPAYCAALQRLRNGPDSPSSSLSCHLCRRRQVSNNARPQLISVDPIHYTAFQHPQPNARLAAETASRDQVPWAYGARRPMIRPGRFASHLSLVD
ncbi:hypothetical protein CSOJ01_05621 [Colletotrichum sojae]|uniref:Uncharacterized protein n=1 Tax=Colletotrichum sojae TaxID=2175907 RepID=A0A8H6MWJ3_9PEZI|nr:hypothetical protein CSOJ01_05621 [Colletotrichum sojae]